MNGRGSFVSRLFGRHRKRSDGVPPLICDSDVIA